MDSFRRYKLVIKIINSIVLNKLQSYSRISALGLEGHSLYLPFQESDVYFMFYRKWTSTRRRGAHMWTHVNRGGGQKSDFLWTS